LEKLLGPVCGKPVVTKVERGDHWNARDHSGKGERDQDAPHG
jgi:hypothetical protein